MPRVIPTGPAVSEIHQGSAHTIIHGILKSRFLISFPYKYEQYDINDSIFKKIYLSLCHLTRHTSKLHTT